MGTTRNGARETLNLLAKICKLSRLPGFNAGVISILGTTDGNALLNKIALVCTLVDSLIAGDNFYNQIDYVREGAGEDRGE